MRRIIGVILLCSMFCTYGETVTPEPYQKDEFLPVLQDVRRASIIFCGAFPLGYMYSSLVLGPILSSSTQYDDLSSDEKSNKEIESKLFSSLIFAGVVMIIDIIIEKFLRR